MYGAIAQPYYAMHHTHATYTQFLTVWLHQRLPGQGPLVLSSLVEGQISFAH